MLNPIEFFYIGQYLEWFLFGVYSGLFALYLHLQFSKSKTVVYYALCLLYVLSAATVVCDLLSIMFAIYQEDALSLHLFNEMTSIDFRVQLVQAAAIGCCDLIAQCALIYRCWIVWGKNIRVVIIPSFLAIAYLATWIVGNEGSLKLQKVDGVLEITQFFWGNSLILTALVASMAVNALVTGLIVYKIYEVLLSKSKVKAEATSFERKLDSLSSTTGKLKYQRIIFVIIESGMALFAIQLVRIVLSSLEIARLLAHVPISNGFYMALEYVMITHQWLNGIAPTIIWVRVGMRSSFEDEESFKEGIESLRFDNPSSDPDAPALGQLGSSSSMPQERNEDIYSTSDMNSLLWRVGSASSSERIEVVSR